MTRSIALHTVVALAARVLLLLIVLTPTPVFT